MKHVLARVEAIWDGLGAWFRQPTRLGMFRSARLKLTLFYLVILLGFSITVTSTLRLLAEHEYRRSNIAQRSEVQLILRERYFAAPSEFPQDRQFGSLQSRQQDLVGQHLNEQFIFI